MERRSNLQERQFNVVERQLVASVKGLGNKSLNLLPGPFTLATCVATCARTCRQCVKGLGNKSACSGDLWRMELT